MTNKDHKLSYKLYKPDGTYIKNLEEDGILSSFQVSKNINGGVGNLKVTINKPIDDYDEYDSVKNPDGSIKYGNRLKVVLNDDDNTDKQIFYGYLVTIGPNYKNGKESVELIFFGAVSKLTNDYYRDYTSPVGDPIDFYVKYVSGAVSPEKAPANASEIIEDVIDNYIGGVTYPMITKSIDDCGGTDLEYVFDRIKQFDVVKKMQEFLPVTWYWYVNGNGVINVKDSASSTQHKLIIGKDITAIKSHKTSEDIINYFVLWNARSTVDLSYVYVTNTDATSKTNYGTHTLFQADSAILSDAIADIRKDKVIEYNKNPTEEITIEVTDEYDIASIEPGDRVSIRNIKTDSQTTFADDLVVVKISYTVNSALIELGALGSNLTKFSNEESNAFEVALKQVYGIQTGGIALTEANIEYGGESFIKKNIIYAPIIAGTTGYFKESIRMGDSGVGSVIRTYGKTGFGDLSSGIWIEKNSSEDIYFELYKDSSNFLRFNTSTGKLEIAGDIVMSVGSTITWAQISDTVVPNTDALSSFDNDDGWTLGATWNSNISGQPSDGAITNPSYITATKITATTIETPTITAGTITGTIVQTSGTANTGVKMSSILGGIDIYGQTMDFKDTSGNLFGYIYGSGSFNILASAGRNLVLSAGSYLYFNPTGNFVIPNNDNDLYLGASTTSSGGSFGSDKTWKYVGAQVIDAKDKYKLNDNDVIDQSGSTMYIKSGGGGGLVLQDGSTTIATFSVAGGLDVAAGKDLDSQYSHLDCVVFGNNSPLTENGTIYFNGTHFYGRIAGAWKQLDN